MADRKWVFDNLTPDMLENVSGGMPDSLRISLRERLADCKGAGESKDELISDTLECCWTSREEWAAAGTTPEEVAAYINEIWDSL